MGKFAKQSIENETEDKNKYNGNFNSPIISNNF